ncbi:MAG: MaoC/PaaZ C-terminal domain-containing protein [Myxococcota bacterium]
MSKVFDYESVDKGTPLDGLSIPALTRVTLARFAGAVDDYNPMHLDDKVAAAAGKSSVFAPSHLVMAYVGRMVQGCFQGAALRRFGLRMLKLVWPGDVLTCRGVVIDKRKENGEHVIDADVWADNQRGETVAKGRVIAVVARTKDRPLAQRATGVIYYTGKISSKSGKASQGKKTKAKKTKAKKTKAKKKTRCR